MSIEAIKDFLEPAMEFSRACERGEVCYGNVPTILFHIALVSLRLNYWTQIKPRVDKFYYRYVVTKRLDTIDKLAEIDENSPEFLKIINDKRPWLIAKRMAEALRKIRDENGLGDDYAALRFWAERADINKIKSDPIGSIRGVGMVSFLQLKTLAGVETAVPDTIVRRVLKDLFNFKGNLKSTIDFIDRLSEETGYPPSALCCCFLRYYAYKKGYLPAYLRPKQKGLEAYTKR